MPIALDILEEVRFEQELEMITLTIGERCSWSLPSIKNDPTGKLEVVAAPDLMIKSQLSFDAKSRTMTYSGKEFKNDYTGN